MNWHLLFCITAHPPLLFPALLWEGPPEQLFPPLKMAAAFYLVGANCHLLYQEWWGNSKTLSTWCKRKHMEGRSLFISFGRRNVSLRKVQCSTRISELLENIFSKCIKKSSTNGFLCIKYTKGQTFIRYTFWWWNIHQILIFPAFAGHNYRKRV